MKNTSRDSHGRYIVKILFKEDPSCQGDSWEIAVKGLNSLGKRLKEYLHLYKSFLKEYLELGYMKEINENSSSPCLLYATSWCLLSEKKRLQN